jgi:hypothetical protein
MNACALRRREEKHQRGEREFSGLLFSTREREVKFSNGGVSIKREKSHLSRIKEANTRGFSIINYTSH